MTKTNPRIWETSFEAYPPDLLDLLGPMVAIPLESGDLIAMGQATPGFLRTLDMDGLPAHGFSDALLNSITEVLPQPDGAAMFPRLGMASFKWRGPVVAVCTPDDLLRVVTRPNPRMASFLVPMLREERPATLYLRPFLRFLPWGEFRVFVMEGRVRGVSQYPLHLRHPQIAQNEAAIRDALRRLFQNVLPALHLKDVVLDVGLTQEADGTLLAHLIELNPAIRRTDPALFDWMRPNSFDGSLRYL